MDKRRKLTYYVHPEDYKGDRLLCEKLGSLEKSEKSRLLRAATIAGYALFMQDERIPYLLTELLDENTTMAEIMQVISSVKPDALSGNQHQEATHALLEAIFAQMSGIKSGMPDNSIEQATEPMVDPEAAETLRNAQSMFRLPISK